MKISKSILGLYMAVAVISAISSCAKEQNISDEFEVRATFENTSFTRLGYEVGTNSIAPSWKIGDQFFGYDNKGEKFTFTVTSVVDGEAIVDAGGYKPGDAEIIYALYYPGKSMSDIQDGVISIDLSSQSGEIGNGFPMIMTASGRIRAGKVSLVFKTGSAILAIRQMKVAPGTTISKIVIGGIVTTGEVNSIHGSMDLIADKTPSELTLNTNLVADANGLTDVPRYISILPSNGADIRITAYANDGTEYTTANTVPGTDILAGNYYYVSKTMGEALVEIVETGELFTTIHNAFDRVNVSTVPLTVKLRKDISVTDSIILKNELNCVTTIDFNGHTVKGSLKEAPILRIKSDVVLEDNSDGGNGGLENTCDNITSRAIFMLYDKTSVTINGGVYKSKADDGVVYFRGISSKIVVNGGKFVNERPAGGEAFYVYGSTGISATINGGSFIDVNGGSAQAIRSGNGAKIVINGGYFHNGNSTGAVLGQATSAGFVGNVHGGYFSKAIKSTYIAEGHTGSATSVEYDGRTYSYKVE